MNNDVYAEWLVKRKTPGYAYAAKAALVVLCVISAFLALTTVFGILILTVVGIATYFLFQSLNLEFEYLFVNGQLTIDRIMGKARRKKAWEGTMEEIQIVTPVDSYLLKDYERPGMKTVDFSSHEQGAKVYALIHQAGANTTKVIFEPNDRILQCMRQKSPRKVIQ
ncbi:MAG: DUF6106 family protein [Hungatella sp.]